MIIDPADVYAGERGLKVEQALARFSIEEVRDEAAFDEGYRALDEAFGGARGELEAREVLLSWVPGPRTPPGAPITARYHMLLARDAGGQLAGVRDCFVILDRAERRCVVLLSHALVSAEFRRTGVAALLRAAPVALARRESAEAGLDAGAAEVLLAAEMDPVRPADRDSVIRLLAYGRAGFRVIPPAALPYAQPDFRDLKALGVDAVPLPMLAVVRQVGEEARLDIPRARAAAVIRHIQTVHACETRAGDLAQIRDHALGALAAFPADPVPLISIPRSLDGDDIDAFAPMLRSVMLPRFPPAWWGAAPPVDPALELEALRAAWSGEGSVSIR